MSPLTKSLIEELEHAPESVQREDDAWRHLEAATWSSFRIRERRPLTARRTHRSVQKPLANRERHGRVSKMSRGDTIRTCDLYVPNVAL
jgi:hypothetical protein